MSILTYTDGYKVDHRRQYPPDTSLVYSNWTPRKSRIQGIDSVIFFGLQYAIDRYLVDEFNRTFFEQPKDRVIQAYRRRIENYLGKDAITYDHVADLHDKGYLPLEIKAVPEGSLVPLRCPMFTIENTDPAFFWLTNFLETLLSCVLWMPSTSATIAFSFRQILENFAQMTGADRSFVGWQGHDFSFRGMAGIEAAAMSGAGHLLSFTGTDTIPAIDFLEQYYHADSDKELIGGSVPATEHSVMCMGTEVGERETFSRLITEIYPKGIVSIVSDTWDFWKVITEHLPALRTVILEREGKVVIRPDSGDPVEIICGNDTAPEGSAERKGAIHCLWDIFGGTTTEKGYRVLDPHIGLIYGDSITLERCREICHRLEQKGFASTNVVLGIGSYTYQYTTRDTFGFAIKATYGEVNGQPREIFKDPKTDDGTKKSARGLLMVESDGSRIIGMRDRVSRALEKTGALNVVFRDGKIISRTSLNEIRKRIEENLKSISNKPVTEK